MSPRYLHENTFGEETKILTAFLNNILLSIVLVLRSIWGKIGRRAFWETSCFMMLYDSLWNPPPSQEFKQTASKDRRSLVTSPQSSRVNGGVSLSVISVFASLHSRWLPARGPPHCSLDTRALRREPLLLTVSSSPQTAVAGGGGQSH